jgi:RNA-splicing ligase RtcB
MQGRIPARKGGAEKANASGRRDERRPEELADINGMITSLMTGCPIKNKKGGACMIEITGKYAAAKVFTDTLEPAAKEQIRTVCEQPFAAGSRIRVMPDVHPGKGCTVGTTMTIGESVVPCMVGVDIGCGMETVKLRRKRLDLPALDSFIRQNIPSGRDVRKQRHRSHGRIDIYKLRCIKKVDIRRALQSLGTLGGGNHFIEVDKDDEEQLYLVIHTGSRNLGLRVAEYYQNAAYQAAGGRKQTEVPYALASLAGKAMENYLHDMSLMQDFAALNRRIIKEIILEGLNLKDDGSFSTIHNYIDLETMILRKGAVSAKGGEKILIPINMRDGSLLCTGLGNADWNLSAPHGAGRLMSRREAANYFTVNAFEKEMAGIYTTSINKDTLDECPMAYKPMAEIIANIADAVKIERAIRPIYNFKAGEHAGAKACG